MAPRSEYLPVPTVSPIEQHRAPTHISVPFPEVRFSDSIGDALVGLGGTQRFLGAYTGQVGAALAHMGESVSHAGDQIFQRALAIKHVENETASVAAQTKFRIEGDKIQDAFQALDGEAAVKGLDAHMKTLEDLRQKVKGTLTNEESRQDYEQHSLRALGSFVTRAGNHGAAQGKAALIAAEDAKIKLTLNDVYKDPDNPDNERRIQESLDTYRRNVAPIVGVSGPKLQLRLQEMRSEFDKQVLVGIAKHDPARGERMLEERRKDMMVADIESVERAVEAGHLNRGPRLADREINADLTEKKTDKEKEEEPTRRDRLVKAEKWVDQYPGVKNVEEFRRRVLDSVENGYHRIINQRKDEDGRHRTILEGALAGTRIKEIPPPTRMEELRAQGDEVMVALDALGKKGRDMAYNAFRANIERGRVKFDPLDSVDRYGKLKGMAASDPSGFMDLTEDINNPKLGMNKPELVAVTKLRSQIRENPMADPRVGKWMGWLVQEYGPEMTALGIGVRRTDKNAEEYDKFVGALLIDVEEFAAREGRAPTRDEMINKIGAEVLKYKPSSWWPWTWTSEEVPAWKENVPAKWAKEHQDKVIAEGGQELTEKEMRQDYQRHIFRESQRKGIEKPAKPAAKPAKPPGPQE